MNSAVFKIEFDRLYVPLCMYSLRILNIREEAEDVVQQCFTAVWQILRNGEEISNLKGYLYRSVRNRSLKRSQELNSELTECIENISENVS